jgi:hypothetical protein
VSQRKNELSIALGDAAEIIQADQEQLPLEYFRTILWWPIPAAFKSLTLIPVKYLTSYRNRGDFSY